MVKKIIAEMIGTFWLTFGGCGSAVLAAAVFIKEGNSPINIGIGLVGVAFAFGLTVLTMAYAIGHISGCHLNPAVTIGLVCGKRFPTKEVAPYILAQVGGAIIAAFLLYTIAAGKPGFTLSDSAGTFATNGYGNYSPGNYSLIACLASEVVLTAVFLFIIMGATDKRRSGRVRSHRHWPRLDPHPPDWNPGHESVGKPGPEYWPGNRDCREQRKRAAFAVVAVLGRTDFRCSRGRVRVPVYFRR